MKRLRILGLVLLLLLPPGAITFAQTATPTPTATPDYRTFVQVGAVELLAGTPPDSSTGWLVCDGSAVSRTTYSLLFAAIGTTFGVGDGSTTFNLPDLRGRVPVGSGAGTGLTARTLGQTFGEETHTLTVTEMPSHNHGVTDPGHTHPPLSPFTSFTGSRSGGTNTLGAGSIIGGFVTTGSSTTGITINNTGGGAAFNQMQPSIVINYVIWAGTVAMPTVVSSGADVDVTVVVVFPSHTPTSTPTPTLTFTPGPSPTPTATITLTPNFVQVGTVEVDGIGQDVGVVYQVTAGDFITTLLLFGIFILLVILVGMKVIRRSSG